MEAPKMPVANFKTAVCSALCISFHVLVVCLEPITGKYGKNGILGLATLNALSGDPGFWCLIWDIMALKGAALPLLYCGSSD